jgi:Uma2 family endonuclease
MPASAAVPVEEYLRTTYEPDMEYVDGRLVERHVGEYFHSRMQALITHALGGRERVRRFRVFTAQRIRISAAPRYRIPDICVKALPHTVTSILEQPDLAIEVLSPHDLAGDMIEKFADYQQAGIPNIWIVDPYGKKVFELGSSGIQRVSVPILHTGLTGDLDFAPLFEELYEPAE